MIGLRQKIDSAVRGICGHASAKPNIPAAMIFLMQVQMLKPFQQALVHVLKKLARVGLFRLAHFLSAAAFFILISNCSHPPKSVSKQQEASNVKTSLKEHPDQISYRTLTREDFLATQPPEDFGGHSKEFGAITCTRLTTNPQTRIVAIPKTNVGDLTTYIVHIEDLSFNASMNRSCSWWNNGNANESEHHLLQHEQIHFALYEIAARTLNRDIEKMLLVFRPEVNSPEEARIKADEFVRKILQSTLSQLQKRNALFDKDTSFGIDHKRQVRWLKKIREELATLASLTSSDPEP